MPSSPFQQTGCTLHLGKWATALCDQESFHGELKLIKFTFRGNGHTQQQIWHMIKQQARATRPSMKPSLVTFLAYLQMTFQLHQQGAVQAQHQSVGLLPRKSSRFLCPVKDNPRLKTQCTASPVGILRSILDKPTIHLDHSERTPLPHLVWTTWQEGGGRSPIQSWQSHQTWGHQNPLH